MEDSDFSNEFCLCTAHSWLLRRLVLGDKTAYIYSTSHCRWVETNGNAILDAVEGLGVG
jgi:hypothetical protein